MGRSIQEQMAASNDQFTDLSIMKNSQLPAGSEEWKEERNQRIELSHAIATQEDKNAWKAESDQIRSLFGVDLTTEGDGMVGQRGGQFYDDTYTTDDFVAQRSKEDQKQTLEFNQGTLDRINAENGTAYTESDIRAMQAREGELRYLINGAEKPGFAKKYGLTIVLASMVVAGGFMLSGAMTPASVANATTAELGATNAAAGAISASPELTAAAAELGAATGGVTAGESALLGNVTSSIAAAGGTGGATAGGTGALAAITDFTTKYGTLIKAGGTAAQIGSTLLASSAAEGAQDERNAIYQSQSELQSNEFNERTQAALDSTVLQAQLDKEGYGARQQVASDATQLLSDETLDRIARDTSTEDEYYAAVASILGERTDVQDSTRQQYNLLIDNERVKQEAFRGEADARSGQLIGESGFDAFGADTDTAVDRRVSFADQVMGAEATPDRVADSGALSAYDAAMRRTEDQVAGQTRRTAGMQSIGDALTQQDIRSGEAIEDLGYIDRNARSSASILPSQLGEQTTKYNAAGERYADKSAIAGNKRLGDLSLSKSKFGSKTIPAKYYSDRVDSALANYYNSRRASEQDYTSNIIGASSQYESNARNNAANAANNVSSSSTASDLLAGFGQAAGTLDLKDLTNSYDYFFS